MLKRHGFSLLLISYFLVLSAADVSAKVKVKKMLITTQLKSWIEQKEITKKFTAKGLFEIIDGGAVDYVNQGLVEGIHQQFANKDGIVVELFIEDFGTTEKASSMVDLKKSGVSDTITFSGLSGFNHFIENAIGASVVFVSIDNLYMEITVSGCKKTSEVEAAVLEYLNYYKSILK
jgi:hypothetical protein